MIRQFFQSVVILTVSVIFLTGCATVDFEESINTEAAVPVQFALNELPFPEQWTQIEFAGDVVGFTHQRVSLGSRPDEMRIDSEAYLRFFVLGVEKQAIIVGTDWVNQDLTLKRFEYRYTVDEVVKRVRGEHDGTRLRTIVVTDDETTETDLPATFPVYPGRAFSLYPVVRGLDVGKQFAFRFYDGEAESIKPVVQNVEAFGTGERIDGSAYKVVSNISGSTTTTWIDTAGRPLLEVSFGGIFFAALQDTERSMLELVQAAFAQDSKLLPYTRIPLIAGAIPSGAGREMTIYLHGNAPDIDLPSDSFQHCWAQDAGFVCQVLAGDPESAAVELDIDYSLYLGATDSVDLSSPSIESLAETLRANNEAPLARADGAYGWLSENIKRAETRNASASQTIEGKRGSGWDLTQAFVALTRQMRIPTRFVNGLAYARENSAFVYHTWAEVWVDGIWHRFDPALSQRRADVTHIKFTTGSLTDNVRMFSSIIGRTEVEVLSFEEQPTQ